MTGMQKDRWLPESGSLQRTSTPRKRASMPMSIWVQVPKQPILFRLRGLRRSSGRGTLQSWSLSLRVSKKKGSPVYPEMLPPLLH